MREDTIEICHLKKAYGEHVIFSNLTMELKKGAVTCLMAPSGAGKTTLLRILAGLEQADGGKIGGLEALRKSMVFQEPRLAEELTAASPLLPYSGDIRLQSSMRQDVGGIRCCA